MIAYHGSHTTKDAYLARVQAHRAADEIIKGKYWVGGKGCAVGCTIHGSDHAAYERELGIPRFLAWIEDAIFERLPNDVARAWPERFLSAIKPGADLSKVGPKFIVWMLGDAECGTLRLCNPAGAEATRRVIALYQREVDGDRVTADEWKQAKEHVWKAQRDAAAAYDAAYAAAYAAAVDAAAAAAAVDAAADAYAAAAYAAAYAADAADAARQAHCVRMADKLIELLEVAA